MNIRKIAVLLAVAGGAFHTPLAAQAPPTITSAQLPQYFPTTPDSTWDYVLAKPETTTTVSNSIWRTDDGGRTWLAIPVNVSGALRGIAFRDSMNGLVVGNGGVILRTTDGGATWRRDSTGVTTTLNAVALGSTFTLAGDLVDGAFAVGNDGIILRNIGTASNTWTRVGSNLTNQDLHGVNFLRQNGFVVGNNRTILRTTTGAMTWTKPDTGASLINYRSVDFLGGAVFAVGDSGVISSRPTISGSGTWKQIFAAPERPRLNSLALGGREFGWAVGQQGITLQTTNAGTKWASIKSGTANDLHSVFMGTGFPGGNQNQVWVAGRNRTIRLSTDGGLNWAAPSTQPATAKDLFGIAFITPKRGFAVGSAETISTVGTSLGEVHITKKVVSRGTQKPRFLEITHRKLATKADYAYCTVNLTAGTAGEVTLLYESDNSPMTILKANATTWFSSPDRLYRFTLEATNAIVETPAGRFTNCLRVRRELNRPCPPPPDYVFFAPNKGIVKFDQFVLCR